MYFLSFSWYGHKGVLPVFLTHLLIPIFHQTIFPESSVISVQLFPHRFSLLLQKYKSTPGSLYHSSLSPPLCLLDVKSDDKVLNFPKKFILYTYSFFSILCLILHFNLSILYRKMKYTIGNLFQKRRHIYG